MKKFTMFNTCGRWYLTAFLSACLSIAFLQGCQQKHNKDQQTDKELTAPSWYANSVIYNLDVETFADSDGDGRGDFRGLTQHLDYLKDLGITAIWLAPFQPTPDQDDGYDITDFYAVDKRLGTMADFQAFMTSAKKRKIRVLMDMVINHTSIEHQWFKAARQDTSSRYHKWYVWSDTQPKDYDQGMVFPAVQTETWTFDEPTNQYYFHRFYDFQPDLNYERDDVKAMAVSVLAHWLRLGVDGFRLDAVPFIIDKPATGARKPEHMFPILNEFRKAMHKINPEAVLLGEANVTAEENEDYFGADANRLQMMFNFYANQYLFYAMAKNDHTPYVNALEEFRVKPELGQWVHFLRNHDEIDLDRLGNVQRQLVYEHFGPETNMRLYDRGIRRRLAPMLGNEAHIRMAYSILFSSPGAQMIRYGEEIGMGDDLALRERLSVRTPMQWNAEFGAGFSTSREPFRPLIAYGPYSYQKVNVAQQLADKSSLLNYIKMLINLRKQHPEIGLGNWKVHESADLLMIEYEHGDQRLLVVHNFQEEEVKLKLPSALKERHTLEPLIQEMPSDTLPAYGYQWFRMIGR